MSYNIFIMSTKRRITLLEISQAAGCSLAVASRALSSDALQHRSVAPETAARVIAVARQLGWTPRKTLRSQRAVGVIGVFLPASGSSLMLELLDSINVAMRPYNTPIYCYSSTNADCYRQFCENHLSGNRTVGVISYYPSEESHLPAFMEMYEKLRRRDLPLVIVHNNAPENFPAVSVKIDNFYGGMLGGEHLLKVGCRKLFVFGNNSQSYRYERLRGCCESFNKHNVSYQTIVREDETLQHELLEILKQIEPFADWKNPEPIGIFADGMHSTLTIHNYFQSKGIAIGQKLKLVGYDDSLMLVSAYPSITAVRQPFAQMGKVAVKKLFNMLNGTAEKSVYLQPELIIRQST